MNDLRTSMGDGLAVAWASVMTFVPKFLVFLAVLIGGYFLAKFLAKLFDKLLERLHFDNVVERGGIKRVLQKSGYDASDVMSKLLFYGLFLLVLQFAFGIFGPNPISNLLTSIISYIPSIIVAAIIIVIASAVGKAVSDILAISMGGLSYGRTVAKLAGTAIVVVGVFAALNQLGIAPAIVNGLFYAVLAIIAGSAIVAIGGGGIQPMRRMWERGLAKAESEAPRVKAELQNAGPVAREKTEEWAAKAQARMEGPEFHPHE